MELDKATRAQVASGFAATLFGGGLIMIFTLAGPGLVIGWLCLLAGLVLFGVLLINRSMRAFLRHPIKSHRHGRPSASNPRMTGEEAKQHLLDSYWGAEKYKASAEWNEKDGHAVLTLQCREAGQIGVRITVADRQQGLRLTHEFHTHVDENGSVIDWFPDSFRDAPKHIARGRFSVVWEVLVTGGVWVQAALADFSTPAPDVEEMLRDAAQEDRAKRQRQVAESEGNLQPHDPNKNYDTPEMTDSLEGEGRYRSLTIGLAKIPNGHDAGVTVEATRPDGARARQTWSGLDNPEMRRKVRDEGFGVWAKASGPYNVKWLNMPERGYEPEVIAEKTYNLPPTGPRAGWRSSHEQTSADEIIVSIERTSEAVPILGGFRCSARGPIEFEGGWNYTADDFETGAGVRLSLPKDFPAAPRVKNLRDGDCTIEWSAFEFGDGDGAGPPVDLGEDKFRMGRDGFIEW